MSEFDCFITRDEFAGLLETAFGSGFRLVLNKNLLRPELEYVETTKAIRPLLEATQYAFILERDDFSRHPIRLRPIERDRVKLWYPRAKEGGPAIEAYFFPPYEKDGRRLVPSSLIAYGAKFVNPQTEREEPTGDSVKKAYEELVAPLRVGFRKVRSAKRTGYVSRGVQAMIDSGWELAQPFSG